MYSGVCVFNKEDELKIHQTIGHSGGAGGGGGGAVAF